MVLVSAGCQAEKSAARKNDTGGLVTASSFKSSVTLKRSLRPRSPNRFYVVFEDVICEAKIVDCGGDPTLVNADT